MHLYWFIILFSLVKKLEKIYAVNATQLFLNSKKHCMMFCDNLSYCLYKIQLATCSEFDATTLYSYAVLHLLHGICCITSCVLTGWKGEIPSNFYLTICRDIQRLGTTANQAIGWSRIRIWQNSCRMLLRASFWGHSYSNSGDFANYVNYCWK